MSAHGLLLALPGHKQPWHWPCMINGSLSSMGKEYNYLHHIGVKKMQVYFFCFPNQIWKWLNPHGCQYMVMVLSYDCNIYWGPYHVTREACVGPFILANHETLLTQPTEYEINRLPRVHRDRLHGCYIYCRTIYITGNPVCHYVISVMPYLAVCAIGKYYAWPTLAHLPLVLHICGSEAGQH